MQVTIELILLLFQSVLKSVNQQLLDFTKSLDLPVFVMNFLNVALNFYLTFLHLFGFMISLNHTLYIFD